MGDVCKRLWSPARWHNTLPPLSRKLASCTSPGGTRAGTEGLYKFLHMATALDARKPCRPSMLSVSAMVCRAKPCSRDQRVSGPARLSPRSCLLPAIFMAVPAFTIGSTNTALNMKRRKATVVVFGLETGRGGRVFHPPPCASQGFQCAGFPAPGSA